jgi:hypothetical protein
LDDITVLCIGADVAVGIVHFFEIFGDLLKIEISSNSMDNGKTFFPVSLLDSNVDNVVRIGKQVHLTL